jgi:uncharacterized membrane protein
MNQFKAAIGGFTAGAMCMYLTDPARGKRRRAVARDKLIRAWHDITNELDKAGRDFSNRSRGLAAGIKASVSNHDASPEILVDRVRSHIGRTVSHPHAIHAIAGVDGRVALHGLILADELQTLLREVSAVPGVTGVENHLTVHEDGIGISSLQGGVPRRHRSEFTQQNWTPALRVTAAAAGGGLLFHGLRSDGIMRWTAGIAGTALLTRAIANKEFRQIAGIGPGAVEFEKTIHIQAPVEEVYSYWANYENFPRFMSHLREVRNLGDGTSHWVAEGPGGIPLAWDARITRQVPNKLLAWESLPGSRVNTEGSVRFDANGTGGTRVTIRMSYSPPAGLLGHGIASFFNADAKRELDDDMVRLKSLIENGKTRAHGIRVTRDEVRAGGASIT